MKNNMDVEILKIDNFQEPDTSLLGLDKEIKDKRKKKKIIKIFIIVFIVIFLVLLALYGPYKGFKNFIIDSSIKNNSISFVSILYGTDAVNERLNKDYIKEPTENTNPDLITINNTNKKSKVILIDKKSYLVKIYNPSKIGLGTSNKLNINASNIKNNSIQGILIQDNKIVFDNSFANIGGGIIGFNNDNKLILGKYTSLESINKGIKNAIEYGPFLIINGKKTTIGGNGGFKKGPKSLIGQKKDGTVLFFYLENATLNDCINMLEKYKVYNGANLPVGENSIIIKNGKINTKKVSNAVSFTIEY